MCREKALAIGLFDVIANAANRRSGHPEAFVHNHSRLWTSAPCLTLTGTSGAGLCSWSGPHPSTFLSSFPRCGFAFRTSRGSRRLGTIKTLTPAQLTYRAALPAYLATPLLSFRLQPRELPGHRLPPRQRDQRFSGLRHGIAGSPQLSAESSSFTYGPTVRLRLLSTPPHGDAVTFGYGVVASSGTDFHRADVAPSRAHDSRLKHAGMTVFGKKINLTQQAAGNMTRSDSKARK